MRPGFFCFDGMTASRSREVEPHVWHANTSATYTRQADVVVRAVTLTRR
jgi:hypothetical protein